MKTFRMVPHHRVGDYLLLGWAIADPVPAHHGHWSALLVWLCACPRKEPAR